MNTVNFSPGDDRTVNTHIWPYDGNYRVYIETILKNVNDDMLGFIFNHVFDMLESEYCKFYQEPYASTENRMGVNTGASNLIP